jgi:hypothetical protein
VSLDPDAVYTVRAIISSNFGAVHSLPFSFRTPPPLPLRPSYRVLLVQQGLAGRNSTKIRELRLSGPVPAGAVVTVSCASPAAGCPNPPLVYNVGDQGVPTLLAGRRLAAGAVLTVSVAVPPAQTTSPGTTETPAERGIDLTRQITRETRTTYHFRASRSPTRSEVCVSSLGRISPCLQIGVLAFGPTVHFVRVIGVPPEASVRYVCRGSRCPQRTRTIVTSSFGTVEFPEFRGRKLKPGNQLEIFVTRPKTIGAATLYRLRPHTSLRKDGCTTVSEGSILVPPGPCPPG